MEQPWNCRATISDLYLRPVFIDNERKQKFHTAWAISTLITGLNILHRP